MGKVRGPPLGHRELYRLISEQQTHSRLKEGKNPICPGRPARGQTIAGLWEVGGGGAKIYITIGCQGRLLGQGLPAVPPPLHHVTSKSRLGFGMQRQPWSSLEGGRVAPAWKGGGGAQKGPQLFFPYSESQELLGRGRFGLVQGTCKYWTPGNLICSCGFLI